MQSFGVGHGIGGKRERRYSERYRRPKEVKIRRRDKGVASE